MELGVKIVFPQEIDTDQFGTFTRDIPRKGTQLDAPRKKTIEGVRLTGAEIGVACEGTFGPSEFGFLNANTEIVMMIDMKNNLEPVGGYVSLQTNISEIYVSNIENAIEFAIKVVGVVNTQ